MTLTIGRLAQVSGVHVETIRYYQRRGLLREPDRPPGSIRRYDHQDVKRLRFIRHAQALGFSLDEVGELLALDDGRHCSQARSIGENNLAVVRQRIRQLQRVERVLSQLVNACVTAEGAIRCPLIDAIGAEPDPVA